MRAHDVFVSERIASSRDELVTSVSRFSNDNVKYLVSRQLMIVFCAILQILQETASRCETIRLLPGAPPVPARHAAAPGRHHTPCEPPGPPHRPCPKEDYMRLVSRRSVLSGSAALAIAATLAACSSSDSGSGSDEA